MSERCGRPTRKGTPCKLGQPCPVHETVDLSARNAAVARSWRERDPEGFTAQRSKAGKAGYLATGARKGWAVANERARQYRLKHPSEPEQWAIGVLEAAGLNHYEREHPVAGGSALDFAWPAALRGIEINGHQARASFGESEPRLERQTQKTKKLAAEGWQILVVDATADRGAGAAAIVEFARAAQPIERADGQIWSF